MRYVLLLLLLSGCATPQRDGVQVIWLRMDTERVTIVGPYHASSYKGYAKMINGVCNVWAPDTTIRIVNGKRTFNPADLQTLGEEIKHCFDGSFHD